MEDLTPGFNVTPILELLRPLGEGGMGKVWVARHKGLETDVVVKFLAADGPDRADAEARFAGEAAAAAAVKSPHVVQVFDHGVTPAGTRYIVMELLEGRDLAQHLAANGPMPPLDVAAVIAQTAKALSKAHQAGVIHRDIKPENIFLCDGDGGEMFVKVLDFGVAKREQTATSKTSTGQVVGTPYYMSPEQLLADRPIDVRTDVWSLGVVAFEALTGKRPFDGATVGSITLAIHSSTPRPSQVLASVPPALDEWFAKACARSPENRFATAREAGQAMVMAVGDRTTMTGAFRTPFMSISEADPSMLTYVAPPAETPERTVTTLSSSFAAEPPPRRGLSKWIIAGALLVVVVLGTVIAVSRPPSTSTAAQAAAAPSTSSSSSAITTAAEPSAAPASLPTPSAASAPTPSDSVAVHPVESAARPKASLRATTPPSTHGTRPKPVRKHNDDDIK